MKAEDCYRQLAEEIHSERQDPAIWAWALAQSGGDADRTKAHYIRRRFADMKAAEQASAVPADSPLQHLRGELRQQLAVQQKKSLYAVLGVAADASDETIAGTIARITATGTPLDAETAYAVEALGDPEAREQFDRRLLAQLRQRKVVVSFDAPLEQDGTALFSGALKAFAGVALALGLGYLGLGYSREKSDRELRLKEAELRQNVVERTAEIADRVVDNQKSAIDVVAAAQARAAEERERALMEARMRDDKYRMDQAYRQEQQLALAEQRRQQSEQYRAHAETRRRDAEAAAATRAIRQQAIQDAIARGNYNEAQRLRNQPY